MHTFALGYAASAVSWVLFLLIVIPAGLVLGFLLLVSPLMLWLNLRRLRIDLCAELAALRGSVDRLSGAIPASQPEAAEAGGIEAVDVAPPPVPEGGGDQIGFSCPGCGKFFEGPASLAGTNYKCPECEVEFHIH